MRKYLRDTNDKFPLPSPFKYYPTRKHIFHGRRLWLISHCAFETSYVFLTWDDSVFETSMSVQYSVSWPETTVFLKHLCQSNIQFLDLRRQCFWNIYVSPIFSFLTWDGNVFETSMLVQYSVSWPEMAMFLKHLC